MSYRSLLAGILVAAGFFAASVVGSSAQTANSHFIFRQWLTATNNGDMNGAAQYLSPNFTVTMADGTSVAGAAAGQQAIMTLGTPVTVVSLTPTSQMELDTQLQFAGSGGTMSVVIKGVNGTIASMTLSASS
jgi:hypothetical protein